MASIYQIIAQNRSRLIRREAAIVQALVEAYVRSLGVIEADLQVLDRQIRAARARREPVSPQWLGQQRWWREVQQSILVELDRYERGPLRSGMAQAQRMAVQEALSVTNEVSGLVRVSTPFQGQVNAAAMERWVTATQPNSPLARVLSRFQTQTMQAIQNGIVEGLGSRTGVSSMVRSIRKAAGKDVATGKIATIVRTETMRAYRGASRDALEALGPNVVTGWEWMARHSRNTCAACLAYDGRRFSRKDYPNRFHVNCRCVIRPVVNPQLIGEPPRRESGEDWLRKQPRDVQQAVLGTRDRLEAYQKGVPLRRFVGTRRSKEWGTSLYVKPASRVRGATTRQWAEDSPESIRVAERLFARAKRAEPGVTADLLDLETRISGDLNRPFRLADGTLVHPLDARLKTVPSTARKISKDANEEGTSLDVAADGINDNLRYTYTVSEDSYGRDVQTVVAGLDARGYERVKLKNSWTEKEEGYTAVHAIYRTPDGQPFEVQFHTDRTLVVKEQISHPLYEKQRKLPEHSPGWERYQREIDGAWRTIRDDPPNLSGL